MDKYLTSNDLKIIFCSIYQAQTVIIISVTLSNFLRKTKCDYVSKNDFVEPNYIKNISFHLRFLSLRLTGVETLKSVSRNFKRKFHLFNLVSDFFSN